MMQRLAISKVGRTSLQACPGAQHACCVALHVRSESQCVLVQHQRDMSNNTHPHAACKQGTAWCKHGKHDRQQQQCT
jgi:hypothetical protein